MVESLNWIHIKGKPEGHLPTLKGVGLDDVTAEGVYIILKPDGPVIRVGQGNIKNRIGEHKRDSKITRHGDDLLVTWASVPKAKRDGIERWLGYELQPEEGTRFPDDSGAIPVNLPFIWE